MTENNKNRKIIVNGIFLLMIIFAVGIYYYEYNKLFQNYSLFCHKDGRAKSCDSCVDYHMNVASSASSYKAMETCKKNGFVDFESFENTSCKQNNKGIFTEFRVKCVSGNFKLPKKNEEIKTSKKSHPQNINAICIKYGQTIDWSKKTSQNVSCKGEEDISSNDCLNSKDWELEGTNICALNFVEDGIKVKLTKLITGVNHCVGKDIGLDPENSDHCIYQNIKSGANYVGS